MINIKRILKQLPKYDNPNPATAKAEAEVVLSIIADAIKTGGFTYTSRRSIRIYRLNTIDDNGLIISCVEVEWKINEPL